MSNRLLIWFIVILTALAVFVDLPAKLPPVKIKIGNIKIEQKLERPKIAINLFGARFTRDLEIKEGLDLAGGTMLILQADMSKISPSDRNVALDALKDKIERRVNPNGVFESVIRTQMSGNDYRIILELPGVQDVDEAIKLVGSPANLTFREEATGSGNISTSSAELYGPFQALTNLSGSDLQNVQAAYNQQTGEPTIELTFDSNGGEKFEKLTRANLNKRLAIFLDDRLVMSPVVQTIIPNGRAVITGKFSAEEVKIIVKQLNGGALPAPVKVISQKTVGASLGQESIDKSLTAGLVGLGIVALFMLANYKKLGLFADLALVIYSLLVLALFKLIPITLTLAGIAGFILSIGMAVDANILIFERMREELRWGRNKMAAIELGFHRAFPSIRDSNASSLITCAILYWFGTGPIRGFAVTLAIGIIVSLFTAVTVTKTLLRVFQKYV